MAITLSIISEAARAATAHATGSDEFTLIAGKHLIIETSPAGVEVLDLVVPKGKVWDVSITVSYAETDA